MKLHRLVLTNYRGIAHREVEFPDRGVVVISGANEIGKSSMIEALDLLLEVKDRSTKRGVKEVKPTHADVGAEVTAEISTGPYRFIYRKRFHKQALTELTVVAPTREQLTGDEAHERVLAILAETVDMELWRAQRILQSASIGPVDLSGSDALSRALDAAAGQAAALSGSEPLLVDEIDAEYRRYFTATGRPTADWLAATKKVEFARCEAERCAAAVADVDQAVVLHGELTDRLARLSLDRAAAAQRLEAAQRAADAVATLSERAGQARALATATAAAHAASVAAVDARASSSNDLDVRAAAIAELTAAAQAAVTELDAAREAEATTIAAAVAAREATEAQDVRVHAARGTVEQLARRDDADQLAARIAKLDATCTQLAVAERALAANTVSDKVMKAVETAQTAVERARMRAELASARVEVNALADVEVVIAGERVELGAGATYAVGASASTDVEVPGLLTMRVVPGEPAADSQGLLDAALEHLAGVLAKAGVPDVDTARAAHERRREVTAARDRLKATCDALLGDDDVDALKARLAQLRSKLPSDCAGDADAARTELVAAIAAHRQATAQSDGLRDAAAAATATTAEHATRTTVLSGRLDGARAELAAAADKLAGGREATSDEQLATAAAEAGDQACGAAAQADALDTELAGLAPDAVAVELAEAGRIAGTTAAQHDELGGQLLDVAAQLKVYGSQGRKGDLDAAEADLEHAVAEHRRLRRRSSAADLLQSVMTRHRDASRLRYVDPFSREVERLGRIVFGDDFEVELDADLNICNRTLGGRTVPYDSLSGGAKEQLGIVARLACAALVAKEDGVPVVIDDALGFTDAVRLTKMGEVFNAVAGDGQVIVLTCSPERYAAVGDARHVELSVDVPEAS